MNLSENIFRLRTKMGLSQGDLANELDVSRQSVSKWENGTATPELEKLIGLSNVFDVSIDELVYGVESKEESAAQVQENSYSLRTTIGLIMLGFGLITLLLSVFWGDNLKFGEAAGEIFSVSVLLASVALLATYNFKVLSFCAIIYFLYSLVCFGILNISSLYNYIFVSLLGSVILVWFIVLGLHHNKIDEADKK